ncbi:hypothetical protein LTR10_017650 [Elasticomyces elasticus]|uniref:Transcription factor domain-containing protein n=1 Tax=Exophiala sideris TaxID=1016849 RepID=A0ABR0JP94_9EURO|nr:hypothetical protein LTR10_017650 [Elasticomyces elasticus]KAK5038295.1 hypothetical protein LTS07_001765 [Exophiala sideris]KAK5044279.1 hypothetical protein LTR13_000635 [Exophiala sideris]KAK5067779.1 hypothetical protein LTR69_001768 [Exophiala sideris]KAK5183981.1 hypothetical protein LTR44_003486 [Eurotiomycetes sp. CCFEE 6388]
MAATRADSDESSCETCLRLDINCEGYGTRLRFKDPVQSSQSVDHHIDIVQWGPIYVPALQADIESQHPSLTTTTSKVPRSSLPSDVSSISLSASEDHTLLPDVHDAVDTPSLGLSDGIFDGCFHALEEASPANLDGEPQLSDTLTNVLCSPTSETSNVPSMDNFYFQHWSLNTVHILPPVFSEFTAQPPRFTPFRNAMLAVSAAHLAHVESSTVVTYQSRRRSRYVPNKEHRHYGLRYYSAAVKLLGREMSTAPIQHPHEVVATLLLFHFFELDAGAFTAVLAHMEGIGNLISMIQEQLIATALGKRLLSTWLRSRSLVVNRRLSLAFGGQQQAMPSLWQVDIGNIDRTLGNLVTTRDSMTVILCECLQTVRKIILDFAVCRIQSPGRRTRHSMFASMLEQMSLPSSRGDTSMSKIAAIDNEYQASLCKQRLRLDQWHTKLDPFELPIESFVSESGNIPANGGSLHVQPLQFHTHDSAMNYAYYAAAQLLSSQEFWQRIAGVAAPSTLKPSKSRWELLILRITAGISPSECVYKNTFDIGIISLLSFCAGWSPDPAVACWVDGWVQKMEEHGVVLDGSVPISILKKLLNLVQEKKQEGCDLYLVSLSEPEDVDRDTIYTTGDQFLIAMCGKNWKTGCVWNEVSEFSI